MDVALCRVCWTKFRVALCPRGREVLCPRHFPGHPCSNRLTVSRYHELIANDYRSQFRQAGVFERAVARELVR